MKRREVYGTTGPRITVRFFGGWDFTAEDLSSRQPAFRGYEKGVPMGADLPPAPDGKAPTFLVAALKDSLSGNIDRIQIIKGWITSDQELSQKVFDVVQQHKVSACGYGPIMALIEYTSQVARRPGIALLRRGNSGEVQPAEMVVDYISFLCYDA